MFYGDKFTASIAANSFCYNNKLFGVEVKKTANEERKIAKITVNLYLVYKPPKK